MANFLDSLEKRKSRGSLVLKTLSGPAKGRATRLQDERTFLGRGPEAHVQIQDRRVSREHAALVHRHGTLMLVDMGSANGTYVNNQALHGPRVLKAGDRIRVGDTELTIELESAGSAQRRNESAEAKPTVSSDPTVRLPSPQPMLRLFNPKLLWVLKATALASVAFTLIATLILHSPK